MRVEGRGILHIRPPAATKTTAALATTTVTAMVPSSTRNRTTLLWSTAATAATAGGEAASRIQPIVSEGEPFLYKIPSDLHPTYRPLPWLVQLSTIFLSAFLSALSTWKHFTWLHPIVALQQASTKSKVWSIISFLVKVRISLFKILCVHQAIIELLVFGEIRSSSDLTAKVLPFCSLSWHKKHCWFSVTAWR